MELPPINYLAVLAAALSAFVLGGLWYSPVLFAKKWMAYTGIECAEGEKPKGNMGVIFGGAFLLSVVAAYLFALIVLFDRLAKRRDRRRDRPASASPRPASASPICSSSARSASG